MGVFSRIFVDFDLDFLRDGQGELTLFWNQVFFPTGMGSRSDSLPSGEILDAVLVVDGTPVETHPREKRRRNREWGRQR